MSDVTITPRKLPARLDLDHHVFPARRCSLELYSELAYWLYGSFLCMRPGGLCRWLPRLRIGAFTSRNLRSLGVALLRGVGIYTLIFSGPYCVQIICVCFESGLPQSSADCPYFNLPLSSIASRRSLSIHVQPNLATIKPGKSIHPSLLTT